MKVSIAKIKSKAAMAVDFTFTETIHAADYGYDDFVVAGLASVSGKIVNLGLGVDNSGQYQADIHYQTEIELICSRCGKPFTIPVEGALCAQFVDGAPDESDGEADIFSIEKDHADIAAVVLSEIFFTLPMQPLCREDCKGLCPKCGVDLNVNSCSCERVAIDPRWEKLKSLLPTED